MIYLIRFRLSRYRKSFRPAQTNEKARDAEDQRDCNMASRFCFDLFRGDDHREVSAMRTMLLACIISISNITPASGLTRECNTEKRMAKCCELYERSLHEKLPQFGSDLARQCQNEIVGARDHVDEQKSFNACIPKNVTNERLSQLFRRYVANHPEFLDRPARFGMLNVWSLSWPCNKR